MVILMLGDIVGQHGCEFVRERLPAFKRACKADVVIANGENSAEGNGMLPSSIQHLWDSGVDVVTSGNHALRRREIYELLDSGKPLLRPANFHPEAPGVGVYVLDLLHCQLAVVNLQGQVYLDTPESPFDAMDRLLPTLNTRHIVVDFHAEATSEKIAMAFYLDGKVSAIAGTHTHIPTADERIMPQGTAYVTDLGMCASYYSALGVKPQQAIARLRTRLPVRFENEKLPCRMSGILVETDNKSGKAHKIERFVVE